MPNLVLSIRALPEEAVPVGETITFTVRLANRGGSAQNVVVSGTLSAGLDCDGCGGFYEPASRLLHWTLPSVEAGQVLSYTFTTQVQAEAGRRGGVLLPLGVCAQGMDQAARNVGLVRADYPVPDAPVEVAFPSGQGGQLVSGDGRMTVTFPMEAVGAGLTVAYTPTTATVGSFIQPLNHFEIVPRDPGG